MPDNLKGLRMYRPSTIAGDTIEAAGGTPVDLLTTYIYTLLQRDVLDGLSLSWDATGSFRLIELTNTHTSTPFYSSAIMVTMNKDKYNSLPDNLKKVIDDNFGMQMGAAASKIFDAEDKAKGDTMIDILNPLNDSKWKDPLKADNQKYLKDVIALNSNAQVVYRKSKEVSAACQS